MRVIQLPTLSTHGEYDSRPPLARYVWCVTWYLCSSCCSETHYAHVKLLVFLPFSTLDVTPVRKCTRPSLLYRTASDGKLGVGLGTRLPICMLLNPLRLRARRTVGVARQFVQPHFSCTESKLVKSNLLNTRWEGEDGRK